MHTSLQALRACLAGQAAGSDHPASVANLRSAFMQHLKFLVPSTSRPSSLEAQQPKGPLPTSPTARPLSPAMRSAAMSDPHVENALEALQESGYVPEGNELFDTGASPMSVLSLQTAY